MSGHGKTVSARVKLESGMRFSGVADSGHQIFMDGPSEHGGSDSAPRPMEMLLMGLGGCTAMDAISILRKKKQVVTGFHIDLKGMRAPEHPMRYEHIEIEFVVTGKGLDEAAVKRAMEISMEKYCSVKFTLEKETDIKYTYKVEEG